MVVQQRVGGRAGGRVEYADALGCTVGHGEYTTADAPLGCRPQPGVGCGGTQVSRRKCVRPVLGVLQLAAGGRCTWIPEVDCCPDLQLRVERHPEQEEVHDGLCRGEEA